MTDRDGERLDLQASPSSVSEARRFVRQVLTGWGMPTSVDTVALLTSELATNAVVHARTAYAVVVTRGSEVIRVDVLDGSDVPPSPGRNTATGATGRGVAMVARLATAWGATPPSLLDGFAKGVWFIVPVEDVDESAWTPDHLDEH